MREQLKRTELYEILCAVMTSVALPIVDCQMPYPLPSHRFALIELAYVHHDSSFIDFTMFKKFSLKDDVKNETQVKSSVQRGIRAKLTEQYPALEPIMEDILPKKTPMVQLKCSEHINLFSINSEILFFQHFDGPYMPTLKLLHKYPDILPKVQVDRGAIKFILSGANIMCPGLTSKGARMDVDIPEGKVVAVMAEGKEHALAVGLTKMSTQDIRNINKDVGIDTMHYLRDDLWKSLISIET